MFLLFGQAVRDFREVRGHADRLIVLVQDVRQREVGAEGLAGLLAPLDLDQRAAVVEEKLVDLSVAPPRFVRIEEKDVLSDRLLGQVAEQALRTPVPAGDVARHVHRDHRFLILFVALQFLRGDGRRQCFRAFDEQGEPAPEFGKYVRACRVA